MAVWRRLERWLCWFPWYRRRARESDLARELGDHLELEAAEQREAGLPPEEAAHAAHRALADQFKARTVHKRYEILVHGRVEAEHGRIEASVGRDPARRARMKVGGIGAREAVTEYRVVRRFHHFTLLDAEPQTGRTHQIRVHFASLHHPVVGDRLYGAPGKLRIGAQDRATLERTFLHAAHIEFQHPRTGAAMSFTSPLPPRLAAFLEFIEKQDR